MRKALANQPEADLAEMFRVSIRGEAADGMAATDTARTYERETRAFCQWCAGHRIDPLQATREDVVSYRRDLDERYAPASVSLKLSAVRRFYAAAKAHGMIEDSPAADVRGPKQRRRNLEFLSELELDRVFSAVTGANEEACRDRAILGLMGLQGLRVIEVTRLNVEDLAATGEAPDLRVIGRGGAEDRLPILPGLADRVREYWAARGEVKPGEPMFVTTRNTRHSGRGERLSRRTVQSLCAKYFRAAGVTARAHALRHTAGALAMKNGADLLQVQAMLRHTDSKTTVRYTHVLNPVRLNPAQFIPVECG